MMTCVKPSLVALFVAASILVGAALIFSNQSDRRRLAATELSFHPSRLTNSNAASSTTLVFKILQLADLHFGEAEDTDWGPLQDILSLFVIDAVIESEKPDLIILSGDQITANNINRNATSYVAMIGKRLQSHGIPWAIIFGNHDDAPLEVALPNGSLVTYPAKTSRRQLLRADQSFSLSLSKGGPANLFGTSNYVLYLKDKKGKPAVQIIFLDSGGGSLPQKLETNQINWLRNNVSHTIPSIAFQHIPASVKTFGFDQNRCRGLHDDGVAPLSKDPGIVQALLQAGNVHFLAVGHNHGNDYCCPVGNSTATQKKSALHVCFGRHSGYGGYGSWERGARVYQLQLSSQGKFSWKSWVRLEFGEVVDSYQPSA